MYHKEKSKQQPKNLQKGENMNRNQLEMSVNLKRIEVCDLLLACLAAKEIAGDNGKKWDRLHEFLKDQLHKFDDLIDKEEIE